MEDEDEFGNLYANVLLPSSITPEPLPTPSHPPPENTDDGDGGGGVLARARSGSPYSKSPPESVVPDVLEGGNENWIHDQTPAPDKLPLDWSDGEDEGFVGVDKDAGFAVRETEAVVTQDVGDRGMDSGQEPAIPGISVASVLPGTVDEIESREAKVSKSGDWDSDSEDDLHIVLNDYRLSSDRGNAAAGLEDENNDDGEDDLVIVTDEDQQQHHHHQGMEVQGWEEQSHQKPLDGERKEQLDAARGDGEISAVAKERIEYSSHGYHLRYNSQFKYIRPGAAAGIGSTSGQVHPSFTMGPMVCQGRGAQKSFHSGHGLIVWSSGASGRAYGSGLEFTLPSHRTIFEIDVDDFEEKPWRHPGIDISDFFNFGLNEDKWKAFCKQLEQLRLEANMQRKIRVYESGRKDYDPDLPPELAAATGLHEISAESTQHGKRNGEQGDLFFQERGSLCLQPQLPIGRAIQVENSFSERLPSVDTRPPRLCDSGAIIEIELQDSVDVCNGTLDQYKPQRQDDGDNEDEDDEKHADSEHCNRFPLACNGRKSVITKRKRCPVGSLDDTVPEGNAISPFLPDGSSKHLPSSKSQTPNIGDGHHDASSAKRWRETVASVECSEGLMSDQRVKLQICNSQKEGSGEIIEDEGVLQISPVVALPETAEEVNLEQTSAKHNDKLALDDSAETEREGVASDLQLSGKCHGDNGPCAAKKLKLSSRVERLDVQNTKDRDDLRSICSDENKARSGSSKDYLKSLEGGEEEVMQGRQKTGDLRRHRHKEEQGFQQRDDYRRDGRRDRNVTSKGREDVYQTHLHMEWDSTNSGCWNEVPESGRTRDGSFGSCLREDDSHCRKRKGDDVKQKHDDIIYPRHVSKVGVSERKVKSEDLLSKKHIGDGDLKSHHDRDCAPRQRERDDISTTRHGSFDDTRIRGRKDDEHPRREKETKEDVLHIRKSIEGTTHCKREKDNGVNKWSREDKTRLRDKGVSHFRKHQADNLRHRERDKRPDKRNEDVKTHTKRERGHDVAKGGQILDNKHSGGTKRVTSASKGLGSDNYPPKDKRQYREYHKRADSVKEHSSSQHIAHQKIHSHENKSANRKNNLKEERCGSHSSHPLAASDGQQMCRERHREDSGKSKESLAVRKRKHEDQNSHVNEKVGAKSSNKQEGSGLSSALLSKREYHLFDKLDALDLHRFPGNHAEENSTSDDEGDQNLRRGRSKMERWTSHGEGLH